MLLLLCLMVLLPGCGQEEEQAEPDPRVTLTITIVGAGEIRGLLGDETILELEEGDNRILKDNEIQLTAQPDEDGGYLFCFWEGDIQEDERYEETIQLTMDRNKELSVYFTALSVGGEYSYSTIQEAIDAADNGDIIVVTAGEYDERINFQEKNLILQSTNPWDAETVEGTIITSSAVGSILTMRYIDTSQEQKPTITGFTIKDGQATDGGAIYGEETSPVITNNRFLNNTADYGGGIYLSDVSKAVVLHNTFEENEASFRGGGIFIRSSSEIELKNNEINQNTAQHGGGIYISSSEEITLKKNAITENTSSQHGGGLRIDTSQEIIVHQCDIDYNEGNHGGGMYLASSTAKIYDNRFRYNESTSDGAGLCITDESDPMVYQNRFGLNNAGGRGGGIFISADSTVKDENENSWSRNNFPPNPESHNEYFENTHGEEEDDGADVFFE